MFSQCDSDPEVKDFTQEHFTAQFWYSMTVKHFENFKSALYQGYLLKCMISNYVCNITVFQVLNQKDLLYDQNCILDIVKVCTIV